MNSLPDAERDATEVAQLLAGLAVLLRGRDLVLDEDARVMLTMALQGSVSAARVLAYLHALQGAGDGAVTSVPPRLGPWRDWVPPRGHLLGETAGPSRMEELPRHRRGHDPGE